MVVHSNRRRTARVLLAAALGIVGVLGWAAPGAAAGSTAADRIDPHQRLAYVVATHGPIRGTTLDPVGGPPAPAGGAVVPLATTCWYFDDYRYGKNVFGGTLFTFHTRTNWCGDGSWIRDYAYTTADASTAFGWAYFGLTQNYDEYGVGWNQFHSVRQGQFCLLNCIAQNVYLTNDVLVGPAGQIWRS